MLKFYLITPFYVNYDEYAGFVVCAEDEEDALKCLYEDYDIESSSMENFKDYPNQIEIKEIKPIKRGVVFDSYNAG